MPVMKKDRDGLTTRERMFCETYLATLSATRAYRAAFPNARPNTVSTEGGVYLARPACTAYVRARLEQAFANLNMAAAEALGRVAQDARSDIRDLFDENGRLLPPQKWPDAIANSVEAFEMRADGSVRVKLVSKLAARRTMLELTGSLRDQAREQMSALAKAIRADLGLAEPKQIEGNRPVNGLPAAHGSG
jgi:phage terminase small subunit